MHIKFLNILGQKKTENIVNLLLNKQWIKKADVSHFFPSYYRYHFTANLRLINPEYCYSSSSYLYIIKDQISIKLNLIINEKSKNLLDL